MTENRTAELDPDVLAGVLGLLGELKEDWEYEESIDPQTRFIADLGLESLEIVVLSTMIQQQYGKLPFPAFFDEIGQRPIDERDVTVAELVAFVASHRPAISQEV
jgi:acyl carrier protein